MDTAQPANSLRSRAKPQVVRVHKHNRRTDLAQPIKDKVRSFFLDYGMETTGKSKETLEHERKLLANIQTGSFRASSNKQLVPLRQIGLFRDKLKIEADDKRSADEKATKIREIDAKLAQLQREAGA